VITLLTPKMLEYGVRAGMALAQSLVDRGQTEGRPNLYMVAGIQNEARYDFPVINDAFNDSSWSDTGSGQIVATGEIGDGPNSWAYPFAEIAEAKFEVSARTGLSTRKLHTPEHRDELNPGDVMYWGSIVKRGIVIAASGFKSPYDEAACLAAMASIDADLEVAYQNQIAREDGVFNFTV
jgi:hypothetical protein